jgi:hypothetical protein
MGDCLETGKPHIVTGNITNLTFTWFDIYFSVEIDENKVRLLRDTKVTT